jgi:hypothetical protein
MGNKPSGIARKAADEAEIADVRASPSTASTMDVIIAGIARLNPANRSTIEHHGDDTEPNHSTPDYPADDTEYPLITCNTRFDSLSETSSCITDYMDGLPLAPVKDVVPETTVKPDVDEVKALFSQLGSQDKIGMYARLMRCPPPITVTKVRSGCRNFSNLATTTSGSTPWLGLRFATCASTSSGICQPNLCKVSLITSTQRISSDLLQ